MDAPLLSAICATASTTRRQLPVILSPACPILRTTRRHRDTQFATTDPEARSPPMRFLAAGSKIAAAEVPRRRKQDRRQANRGSLLPGPSDSPSNASISPPRNRDTRGRFFADSTPCRDPAVSLPSPCLRRHPRLHPPSASLMAARGGSTLPTTTGGARRRAAWSTALVPPLRAYDMPPRLAWTAAPPKCRWRHSETRSQILSRSSINDLEDLCTGEVSSNAQLLTNLDPRN